MRILFVFMLVVWANAPRTVGAQSYSPAERMAIAGKARRLLADKYFANIEILTNYEANQPFDALQNQLNGLIRDAFRSREVLVFNEFRNPAHAYTTVEEYVKDCRIFSGGKPIVNKLNLSSALYDIQQTKTGEPFVNVYLNKQLEGSDGRGKAFRYQNLIEFRVQFNYSQSLNTFLNFKIAGISKVAVWPPTAFVSPEIDPIATDADEPKNLLSVITTLTQRLAVGLPTGTRQLVLEPFTYNRSGINDALSDRIFATFSRCLQRQDSLAVTSAANYTGRAGLVVRGYYKEDINTLRIIAELLNSETGNVLTTAESAELPLTWLSDQKLPLKPETYQRVTAVRDTLQRNTATIPTALHVEIRTDRGRTNVEYWANQVMRIEAVASRPCHLRLLYRLADGTQTILENDFTIKPGQENRPVAISPEATFVCSAPFGTEYLLAYASETPFCPLPTVPSRQGYVRTEGDYKIFVGPLQTMLTKLKCTQTPGVDVAEDRIQITTRSATK